MRKPCRCNSSASLRVLLQVQRKGDSGSPRVVGLTNASRAWRIWGSAKGFRPPPLLRILPPSSAFPAPLFNSRIPAWIVLRDRPVACATSDTPPCGNACASVAAQSRRCRSSSTLRSAWYFLRIPPTSSFCPMRKAYHTYLMCTSYLCAEPKVWRFLFWTYIPSLCLRAIVLMSVEIANDITQATGFEGTHGLNPLQRLVLFLAVRSEEH